MKQELLLASLLMAAPLAESFARDGRDWGQWNRRYKSRELPDWVQSQYYGIPSVRLDDDPIFAEARRDLKQTRRNLRDEQERLTSLENRLKKNRKILQGHQKSIRQLKSQIQANKTDIQNLNKNKAAAQKLLPGLQRKLTLAKQVLKAANQAVKKLEDQKKNAQLLIRKLTPQARQANLAYLNAFNACKKAKPNIDCNKDATVAPLLKKRNQLQKQMRQQKSLIAQANLQLPAKKEAQRLAQQNKKKAQSAYNVQNKKITDANTKVPTLRQANVRKRAEVQRIEPLRASAQNKVNSIQVKYRDANENVTLYTNSVARLKEEVRGIRSRLVNLILDFNSYGYRDGAEDGESEGLYLAQAIGEDEGYKDGRAKGLREGASAGRARERAAGVAQGKIDGENDGNRVGKASGLEEGRIAGNNYAGYLAGDAKGIDQAINSNAKTKGNEKGVELGLKRADTTGNLNGTAQGQREAIAKYEDQKLKTDEFAGTFDYYVPRFEAPSGKYEEAFPCSDNWQLNRIRNRERRRLLKRACIDGYDFGYYDSSEIVFNNNIGEIYSGEFSRSESAAYTENIEKYYQASYDKGHGIGHGQVYETYRRAAHSKHYGENKTKYTNAPEKDSKEYTSSFEAQRVAAYNLKYGEIFDEERDRVEPITFNANIVAKTKHYRDIRFDEVEKIYKNYPVLKHVSSRIKEIGINGIAAGDKVYQPSESIAFDITVKNFGLVPAKNVSVALRDGTTAVVAEIPAQSVYTIKNAVKTTVRANKGHKESRVLYIKNKLMSQDKSIEGRHYYKTSSGVLNSGDQYQYYVKYPLKVKTLSAMGPVILGQEVGLRAEVENNSQRKYNGPLELKLETSQGQSIITQEFSDIQTLDQLIRKSDAKITIDAEEDALKYVDFKATVSKDGVLLGEFEGQSSKLVQINYKAKDGAPVIVANAMRSTRALQDLIAELGGIEQVSVADTALKGLQVINQGLSNKVINVIDDGLIKTKLNPMLEKSENAIVNFPNEAHFENFMTANKDGSMKYQSTLVLNFVGAERIQMTQANKFTPNAVKVAKGLYLTQMDARNLEEMAVVKKYMGQTNEEALASFKALASFANAQAPSDDFQNKGRALVAKMMFEIDHHYKLYRGLDSKDWRKRMPKDANLLVNKLKEATYAQSKAKEENAAVAAVLMTDTLKYTYAAKEPFKDYRSRFASTAEGMYRKLASRADKYLRKIVGSKPKRAFDRNQRKIGYYLPFQ